MQIEHVQWTEEFAGKMIFRGRGVFLVVEQIPVEAPTSEVRPDG